MDKGTKPERVEGLAHVWAAFTYSLAGIRRLWREAAFRQQTLLGFVTFVVLWATGAQGRDLALFSVLCLLVFATEAVNTAIEELVDHLSPEWSQFAKHAKDLGSVAVMFVMLGAGLFAGATLYSTLF